MRSGGHGVPITIFVVVLVCALGLAGCTGFFTDRLSAPTGTSGLLYTANFNGGAQGSISEFTIAVTTGFLGTVTGSPISTGTGTVALALDPAGKFIFAANQTGGINGFSVDHSSGKLIAVAGSPFPGVAGSTPTDIVVDPKSRFVFVAASGSNSILAYTLNSTTGLLSPVAGSPFAAAPGTPLGVAVDPAGKFLYVSSGAAGIKAFTISSSGVLAAGPAIAGAATGSTALRFNSAGTFAYSVDGISAVSAYSADASTGVLTLLGSSVTGTAPLALDVDPLSKFLYVANQSSGSVSAFKIASNGNLAQISGSPYVTGSSPTAVRVDKSSNFVYVANQGSSTISIFTINSGSGALTAAGTTATGTQPVSIVVTQ